MNYLNWRHSVYNGSSAEELDEYLHPENDPPLILANKVDSNQTDYGYKKDGIEYATEDEANEDPSNKKFIDYNANDIDITAKILEDIDILNRQKTNKYPSLANIINLLYPLSSNTAEIHLIDGEQEFYVHIFWLYLKPNKRFLGRQVRHVSKKGEIYNLYLL